VTSAPLKAWPNVLNDSRVSPLCPKGTIRLLHPRFDLIAANPTLQDFDSLPSVLIL
jgi:hypothetical protein